MDSASSRTVLQGTLFLLIASMVAVNEARRTIVVGDSDGWRSGTNYTDWSIRNSPFFINDNLVFKYPPPGNSTAAQSVYLLPNLWSYITCNFKGAKLLANATQGGGEGFKIELNEWRPYYFASAEGSGYDCLAGLTKFIVVPFPLWY